MDRVNRKFAVLAAWCFVSGLLGSQMAVAQPGENPTPETVAKIVALERQLEKEEGRFNWVVHNELRHLYGGFDDRQAFYHCDVLLKHSMMDDYILSILSSWEIKDNRPKAVANLTAAAGKYREFVYVSAACLIKAAELDDDSDRAAGLYKQVIDMRGPNLVAYRKVAETGLGNLNK